MANKLQFSVHFSSFDKYSGDWSGNITDPDGNNIISNIAFEFIPGIHENKDEHQKHMIDVLSTVARIFRYERIPSPSSRMTMSFPSATAIDFSIGSKYSIRINGVTLPYNRLRNNMVTLSYSYRGVMYDIVLKNQHTISSLPRSMF